VKCIGVLVVVATVAHAHADTKEVKPDPSAVQAGEANLESTAARQGYVFTFAVGGSLTLGFGVNDSTGTGGGGVIRLAHVATPRTLITLEVVGSALFHQVKAGDMTTTYTNQNTTFLLGAQVYANPALWFRFAGGFGRYFGDEVLLETDPGQPTRRGDIRLAGPAGSVGAGVDLLRLKRFRMGFELIGTGMVNREGVLTSGGFLIGFTVD
jgi:hypothetical protein